MLSSEIPCLTVQWHTFANRQQFRPPLGWGLELFVRESGRGRPLGWLADTRQVSAVTPDDQHRLCTGWNQRAYAAGIRQVGFVAPESIFGQKAVQSYKTNTEAADAYTREVVHHHALSEAKERLQQALHGLAVG